MERFDFLKELYSSMLKNAVPSVIKCMNIEQCSKRSGQDRFIELELLPHDCQLIPPTLDLLLGALKLGYAHRDIRWPNVLRVTDED